MEITYCAIFQYDLDGICISFPDIPPALTCADNELDGIEYAKEVLDLVLYGLDPNDLPVPTPSNSILLNSNQKIFKITIFMQVREGYLFSPSVQELEE